MVDLGWGVWVCLDWWLCRSVMWGGGVYGGGVLSEKVYDGY